MDDIFVLFKSADHLEKFRNYFNNCHPNMSFSFEKEKNGKMSFLDVLIYVLIGRNFIEKLLH